MLELLIYAYLTTDPSANAKTISVELDGVQIYTNSMGSTVRTLQMPVFIHAMGAQNVQHVFTGNYTTPFAGSAGAHVTTAVYLSADKTLVVYGQLGAAADSLTMKAVATPVFVA